MSTLSPFNFSGKKALIRVDFNVPLNSDLEVTDASRIEAAKPTIIHVLEQGGSAILMSHLGRPGGEAKPELSLKHIADKVAEILGVAVKFSPSCVGPEAEAEAAAEGCC